MIAAQAPQFAHLPLTAAGCGWDNFMFRLGETHVVRLPRRAAAVPLVEHEQRWLPLLAPLLPLKIPVPVHRGVPGEGYPWPWSICPWIEGVGADLGPPGCAEAGVLATFLKALHRPAPADAPLNPYRSVPLAARGAKFEEVAQRLQGTRPLSTRHREFFAQGLATPIDVECCWIHGDLHPSNMLTLNGRLSGIIDWGDVARGDPATDLSAIFMLFPGGAARERSMAAYQASSATWVRARAWAVLLAAIFLEAGIRGDARMGPIGERTLGEI